VRPHFCPAHLNGVQVVAGSNPATPIFYFSPPADPGNSFAPFVPLQLEPLFKGSLQSTLTKPPLAILLLGLDLASSLWVYATLTGNAKDTRPLALLKGSLTLPESAYVEVAS